MPSSTLPPRSLPSSLPQLGREVPSTTSVPQQLVQGIRERADDPARPDRPEWADAFTDTDRRGLTPLFWTHIAPYGEVRLDMTRRLDLSNTAELT